MKTSDLHKRCARCSDTKPVAAFKALRVVPLYVSHYSRKCLACDDKVARLRQARKAAVGEALGQLRRCALCEEQKLGAEFYFSFSRANGNVLFEAYCKGCRTVRQRDIRGRGHKPEPKFRAVNG